VYMYV